MIAFKNSCDCATVRSFASSILITINGGLGNPSNCKFAGSGPFPGGKCVPWSGL